MNVIILLIVTLSTICVASASDQLGFLCAQKYFQKEKLEDFAVVYSAKHNELAVSSLITLMNTEYQWPIKVFTQSFVAMNIHKSEFAGNIILFASSPTDIDPVFAKIDLDNSRGFIFLTNEKASNDLILSIFGKFISKMQNRVVVVQRTDDIIWKFYRFVDDRCTANDAKSLRVVAQCNSNVPGANIQFFLTDLQVKGKSCPLIVATKQFEPFTYYDDIKGFLNGIDYSLVKTISKRLRLDVKFIRTGNASTVDPKTIENADLVIGGQNMNSLQSKQFIDSRAYFQDDVTWCVQKDTGRAKWSQVVAPIDFMVFLCFFTTALSVIWITYGFAGFQRRPLDIWTSAFLIARTISGTASTLRPEQMSLKIFYMLYLHISFLASTVIVSYMFAVITLRFKGNQITNFYGIVKENFRLAAEKETMNLLVNRNMLTTEQIQTFMICKNMDECMRVLEKSDEVAVAISRYYARIKFDQRKVHCFPTNIRSDLVMLKMHETSIEHIKWNNLIQRITEAGLIVKWSRVAVASTTNRNEIDPDAGFNTIDHFIGIFAFVGGGWILAILIAIFEQIVHYKVKQVNHHRYWDVCDMLIDGERHMWFFNRDVNRHRSRAIRNRIR